MFAGMPCSVITQFAIGIVVRQGSHIRLHVWWLDELFENVFYCKTHAAHAALKYDAHDVQRYDSN